MTNYPLWAGPAVDDRPAVAAGAAVDDRPVVLAGAPTGGWTGIPALDADLYPTDYASNY